MDGSVDEAGGPAPAQEPAVTDGTAQADGTGPAEGDVQDIESELYSSTREAGIVAAGFTPVADS